MTWKLWNMLKTFQIMIYVTWNSVKIWRVKFVNHQWLVKFSSTKHYCNLACSYPLCMKYWYINDRVNHYHCCNLPCNCFIVMPTIWFLYLSLLMYRKQGMFCSTFCKWYGKPENLHWLWVCATLNSVGTLLLNFSTDSSINMHAMHKKRSPRNIPYSW